VLWQALPDRRRRVPAFKRPLGQGYRKCSGAHQVLAWPAGGQITKQIPGSTVSEVLAERDVRAV